MQFITTTSKFLLFVVFSCAFLVTWNCVDTNITGWSATVIGERSSARESDSIWANMSSELRMDHRVQTAQVRSEIRKILADQNKLNDILKAAGPYIYYIYSQTKLRGLPAELALIPVIESEFNPNDHSNKGALGLWQLMPANCT